MTTDFSARAPLACLLFALAIVASCSTFTGGSISTADPSTLVVAMPIEPTTLDPAKVQDLNTSELVQHCFEGLVRYDEHNRLEPLLAERWDISKDGRTYTFHIRHGVQFHNGRELTAADFKYSWERALAPKTASPVAANYLDGILGVKGVVSGKRTDLAGVRAPDKYTLQVRIDRPRSYFLGMLSYPTGDVVCREAVEKTGGVVTPRSAVGTGPFMLTSYRPGQAVILTANPHYRTGRPRLSRVVYEVILDPDTQYQNFVTHRVDITVDMAAERYAQDRDAGRLKAEYRVAPTAAFEYLAMNEGAQPVFRHRSVRMAIALAIDRRLIWRLAYKKVGRLANGALPPELSGGQPDPPPIPYDPARARRLLARAGYPRGAGFPHISLLYQQHLPRQAAAAQIIAQDLENNLGIHVSLEQRESGQFWSDESRGVMSFYITNWYADYPDPQDFLSTLFTSSASLDYTRYHNAQFDALCARADAEPEQGKRAALYAQADDTLMSDVPVVPLIDLPRIHLIHANVHGWRSNMCDILPNDRTYKTGTTR